MVEVESEESTDKPEEIGQSTSSTKPLPLLTPQKLRQLLGQTIYGKQVLQNGATHTLSDPGRRLVVDTVARYHLQQNRKSSSEAISDLSDVIIEVFKEEAKVNIPRVKILQHNERYFFIIF